MIKNGIDYLMKSTYYGFITAKSEQRILKGAERNAVIKDSNEFFKHYVNWYVKARKILENARAKNEITAVQLETFFERQYKIYDYINQIRSRCFTGEMFFDFNAYEKDYMGKYESKEVYHFFGDCAYHEERFIPEPYPVKQPKKRVRTDIGDIDFNVKSNRNYAFFLLDDLADENTYYTGEVVKNNKLAVKNGLEYNMWDSHFGVQTPCDYSRTLTSAQVGEIKSAYNDFTVSYKVWYSDARWDLEKANADGDITDAELSEFYARQSIIKEYLQIIFDACVTGKVYFDFAGFEKMHYFKYASKKVYLLLEGYANYAKYFDVRKGKIGNLAIRNGIEYEMKTPRFGVATSPIMARSAAQGVKSAISRDIETFKANRQKWYDATKAYLDKNAINNVSLRLRRNEFNSRQMLTENYLKTIFEKCKNGVIYLDFAGFENDYISNYESKEVFKLYETFINQSKHFDEAVKIQSIADVDYSMRTGYFGIITATSKGKELTEGQIAVMGERIQAFKDDYKAWYEKARKTLEKAHADKKVNDLQLYTFLIRQDKIQNYFDTIFEKSMTGEVYFGLDSIKFKYKKEYESAKFFMLMQSMVEEIKNNL